MTSCRGGAVDATRCPGPRRGAGRRTAARRAGHGRGRAQQPGLVLHLDHHDGALDVVDLLDVPAIAANARASASRVAVVERRERRGSSSRQRRRHRGNRVGSVLAPRPGRRRRRRSCTRRTTARPGGARQRAPPPRPGRRRPRLYVTLRRLQRLPGRPGPARCWRRRQRPLRTKRAPPRAWTPQSCAPPPRGPGTLPRPPSAGRDPRGTAGRGGGGVSGLNVGGRGGHRGLVSLDSRKCSTCTVFVLDSGVSPDLTPAKERLVSTRFDSTRPSRHPRCPRNWVASDRCCSSFTRAGCSRSPLRARSSRRS